MEYEIDRTVCKKCNGEKKCTRMCDVHTCKALINYLNSVDTSETHIGEFSSRVRGGKQDLIVSGHQIYGLTLDAGNILTDISTILDATRKFQNNQGRTVVQMLNASKDELGLTLEEAKYYVDFISKINSNKLVIVPFKPETHCIVATPKGYQSETDGIISNITWRTNKETHKLEATVRFKQSKGTGVEISVSYKMSEYMDMFRLKTLNLVDKGEKIDRSLIKMTDYGIIKPVEIEYKDSSITVDNTYIYYTVDGVTKIIGGWNLSGDLIIVDNIKGKHMTKIKENISLIKSHRKYIAPYTLYEANTIKL